MSDTAVWLHAANTAARWSAMDLPTAGLPDDDDVFSRLTTSGAEINTRRPLSPDRIEDLLDTPVQGARNAIWDPFGVGGVRMPEGVRMIPLPVMTRPAGPVEVRPGAQVVQVSNGTDLARADRVIIDGFPRPELQPGQLFPPHVLDRPGWQTWLALRDGDPVAAGVSYDDGHCLGAYWLASLPQHRGSGLGATLLTSMLVARPDLPAVLVSTPPARSLYERLGYRTVSTGCWYVRRS
ncbi:GNAT family N-acetyltransferase [Kineosporia sp. NBRC 101731]|uniref:GNAT family N-acetyltransferase n=1 Tax=Kineosporia sp. NBRC 101731 TaxID=3032199 RepID=UPI0024A3B264|nr:GNAT family N-acetyltransferase [Kineosporia sp. NBRC 101731]GLY33030.1 hypothetical protein Kisp02_63950 [Kineosporia sp. NBRC 101731]